VIEHGTTLKTVVTVMPKGIENTLTDNISSIPVEHHPVTIPLLPQIIVPHPDPDVDVCAIIFAPFIATILTDKSLRHMVAGTALWPDHETRKYMRPVERVIMIGYPNALWDEANNLPIVRSGMTGSHPMVDFGGKRDFVIDAACFPGSSGSPVFLYEDGMVRSRNTSHTPGTKIALLGILHSGPTRTVEGKIEKRAIPTSLEDVPVIESMINLGYVARVDTFEDIRLEFERRIADGRLSFN